MLPARQHGDAVAQPFDHGEVMLDHQDRPPGANAADERDHAVHVLVRHARGRLVEQQHRRLERQRGGDLERPLAAIGEQRRLLVRVAVEPDIGQQRARAVVVLRAARPRCARNRTSCRRAALQREPDVLERGQVREHRRDLEAAHQPEPRDLRRLHAGDVAPLERDRAARRRQELGQQVEAGRLAGAVRADQGVDGALLARAASTP